MLRIKHLSFLIFLSFLWTSAQASHQLGGEMFYTCLGNNQYRLTVRIYADCEHGDPSAIAQDGPLYISIFYQNGMGVVFDSIAISQRMLVPAPTQSSCLHDTASSCILYTEFQKIYTLPPGTGPYIIVNQRCCMPGDITNLKDPANTGLALQCTVPLTAVCNNCALFPLAPAMRFPTNKQFLIDLSANDPDGDSLVYRFINDYSGGSPITAKPVPQLPTSADLILYGYSFTAQSPLGNAGILTLNSHTGHLSGICYNEGEYFISVACDEYRNGTLINTVERSLSYSFGDYDREVIAMMRIDKAAFSFSNQDSVFISQCNGNKKVHFGNESKGATSYQWNFGDPANPSAGSTDSTPNYTYPANGKYLVTLIAFGPNCSDTTSGYVVISNDSVDNDFTVSGGPCMLQQFHFSDNSNSHGNTIANYGWQIDGQSLSGANVDVKMLYPGIRKVSHVVTIAQGCVSTVTKDVEVTEGHITACNDTTVMTGTILPLTVTGSAYYAWTALPSATNPISNPASAIPTVNCANTGTNMEYVVTGVDVNGCGATDTVRVTVMDQQYVVVPTAFTPNNDGLNDLLKPFIMGYTLDEMHIFNRRGQEVFYTADQNVGWDGQFKGNPAPVDTYLWMIKAHGKDNGKKTFTGNITLIR